ncbi:twin-arginine translocase TatA/TatE family subunit [Archaeoglobus profundus]|uniref:Sec-independent protein translocase protein TatA n=1 Tax=Archaeoglobus profundus (strain DSM 5631 / JCM 9629 / NBRC 100127 / Av18) TaxID=572546 RepID=D2RDG4_ARCPA|nr:twin-arginine translocase TatA/TatE family subunit [Archaeoglobus profundus]ADB58158.1 twin-arginine translocation protein, TatA/E family subunit [Archaeoglobus profundus DSM 5631]
MLGGLGPNELLLILIIVFLLFGASKLPELARSLGKAKAEFKKAEREAELELVEFERQIREGKYQRDKLEKMAKDLGVETEGKSDEELVKDIRDVIREKSEP